jgi:hypothetical protein
MRAGIDLLPPWAQAMLSLSLSPLQRHTARLAVHGVASAARASVRNGAYHLRDAADGGQLTHGDAGRKPSRPLFSAKIPTRLYSQPVYRRHID